MDNFHPQSAGGHQKEGHDVTDLSIRGVILSAIALAASLAAAFLVVLGFYWGLQKWEKDHQPPMTTMEDQLRNQREALSETAGRTPVPEGEERIKPAPDLALPSGHGRNIGLHGRIAVGFGDLRITAGEQRRFPGGPLRDL